MPDSAAADKAADPELRLFLHYMNGTLTDSPFIRKIDTFIKALKANEQKRSEYMLLQAFEMDARRDGMNEGIQQGMLRGEAKAKLETAKFMKQAHCDTAFIIQATGLSEQDIKSL
ncbi:MAG: hypothetical protein ACTTJ7_07990 [Treponema sp.]